MLRELALLCNRYLNTVEDYYLHGLWRAREVVEALKNAAPGNGGQDLAATGLQTPPTGERCPVAAPVCVERAPFDPVKFYREFPAGGNTDRGDWLRRCLTAMIAAASAVPAVEPPKFFCAARDCAEQCDLCRQEEGNP